MHVHSLEFAAIGPFADEHRIDFDGLNGASLFLIDGPTGAGKSTIIDALVFALFGDVAGRTSDRQRIRSAFAGDDRETFSQVEFSTSFGRFRVRRTPEYERAKRRGTGTTSVASSVSLLRSTGEHGWESVSTHKGEADSHIQRAIGLTRAQFLQTVVLPQGEFATFLSAESKERLAVLERIFATDLYSRIESVLDERRLDAQRQRETADRAVTTALQHVVSRLSDADLGDRVLDGFGDPKAALLDVSELEAEAVLRLVAGRTSVAVVTDELAGAMADLSDATARRAAAIAVRDRAKAVADAEGCLTTSAARLDRSQSLIDSVSVDNDDVVGGIDRLLGSLGQAAEFEEELTHDASRVHEARLMVDHLEARLEAIARQREHALPARLFALSAALEAAVADADARLHEAKATETRLLQARLDGMAGELAAALDPGEACPVCGSPEHPSPAPLADDPATAADVDGARTQRSEVEAELHGWDVEGARLSAIGREVARVPDEPRYAPVSVADVAAGIRGFQENADRLGVEAADLRERRAAAASALRALQQSLIERQMLVNKARAGFVTVAERIAQLRSARAVVVAHGEHRDRVAVAQDALDRAREDLLRWPPSAIEVDVDALEARCQGLQTRLQAARSACDAAAQLVEDLQSRIGNARTAVTQREAVRAATQAVMSLANIVKGGEGNALAQPLSAYVVQTMFDEILEAANRRLQSMLDGRFSLKATEQRTGPARLGQGLGLEIVDHRTETIRKTATLSGGESFCASLALALGLADTVRSHAGGVELGMLLIDEGFGSLDGDRLDEVMAELLRLRSDGRTVGVISHVSEMKKGISERIDVTPLGGRLGSTLAVSWGG
jgi:exonuclease SbcC